MAHEHDIVLEHGQWCKNQMLYDENIARVDQIMEDRRRKLEKENQKN